MTMRKTIGATGFGLILLILSIVIIPLLSTTYKPLAAEQSVTAEEALTIATEGYADLDSLLMNAGTNFNWWGAQDIQLDVIEDELQAIALDEVVDLIKNDASHIFCECDAGVWVPMKETNRFQVNDFNDEKIEASFYQFSTSTVQAGTTHLTFLKEEETWKLASIDWDFNNIQVTEAEVEAHLARLGQGQVEELTKGTVNGEAAFLYRFKDQTSYSTISVATGQPLEDVSSEYLEQSE